MSEMASANDPGLSGRSPTSSANDTTSTDPDTTLPSIQSSNTLPESSHSENMTSRDRPNPPSSTQPAWSSSCYFLDRKTPIEIRIQIYRYMLFNPSLAEFSSVKKEDQFGATASYGLTPKVIATCKQIYQEASEVLYKDNTFFMAFVPQLIHAWPGPEAQLISPLTRFDNRARFSTVSKVRRWKIMLVGKVRTHKDAMSIMTRFCIAISDSQLKSLELLLLPSRDENHLKLNSYGGAGRRRHLIRPLQKLRNIEKFQYRAATASEVPACFHSFAPNGVSTQFEFNTKLRKRDPELQDLQKLVQGDLLSSSLAKMYNSLVR